jgi:type VI protein secretion system component VasF
MDDVIKVLKQIVESFSAFGAIPKPVKVCIAVFSGIFGFSLIFVYARLDKTQTMLLIGAIALMAVATGGYYAWKTWFRKEPDQQFWSEPSPGSPVASTSASAGTEQRRAPSESASADFWGQPVAPRAGSVERKVQPAKESLRSVGNSMTLLQLAEPLMQYVCRLNRLARRGAAVKSGDTTTFVARSDGRTALPVRAAALDEVVARSEIKALLEDMLSRAASDLRLLQQVQKVELPLIFFIDSMVSESTLPFAAHWNQNRLAYERQELAGDEKFFDLLDETLKESGEAAAERLAVFYVCIGLGFTGIYFKQPELLRKTMLSIAPRIRHLVENDPTARICPEAYQNVDTRDLVEPPGSRLAFVGLLFVCCTLAVLISYLFMYRQASAHLNQSIEEVLRQDLAVGSPP